MSSDGDRVELGRLIDSLVEGTITPAERADLAAALSADPDARRYYARYMLMRSLLICGGAGLGAARPGDGGLAHDALADELVAGELSAGQAPAGAWDAGDPSDAMILPAIRPDESDWPDEGAATFAPAPIAVPAARPAGRRWRYAAAAGVLLALAAGAAVLLSGKSSTPTPNPDHLAQTQPAATPGGVATTPPVAAPVVPAPTAPAPATFAAATGAVRWAGGAVEPRLGERLPDGELSLASGAVEVRMDSGASLVVEGPARFRARANAVDLAAGRLAASVPPEARGFTVQTASARAVDLGTEFGVAVAPAGKETAVEVFRGTVWAGAPAAPATGAATPWKELTAGQAARVTAAAVTTDPGGARPQRFVRSLTTRARSLDVVDLVSGGDGTTDYRRMAIDAVTGESGTLPPIRYQDGDGRYHPVAGLPVVDGCFVPDGRRGAMKVDSAGDAFAFPPTTGQGYNRIFAGGPVPAPADTQANVMVMGGVDYSQPPHGLLAMHANLGLTLDLAAVRRLHPDKALTGFRCKVGNYEPKPRDEFKTGLYVLVDGKPRFERRDMTHGDEPIDVVVPINPGDRFLTLAVTDGGDGSNYDGIMWGDPVIDLKAR